MEFEELIRVLASEHVQMKSCLVQVEQAVAVREFDSASKALQDLDRIFRQHIADEEAVVLRVLIDVYGVDGASEEIQVFRQHRPIYTLMEKVKRLASLTAEELESNESGLRELLEKHTSAEENSVFPKAIDAHRLSLGMTSV